MNCATHNEVAAVAFCRTCGKPLCTHCTRDVRGVIYCESCLAARLDGSIPAAGFVPPTQPVYPTAGVSNANPIPGDAGPNPTVAGILGAIPLGLGAVYCGQYAKGLAHLGIFVLAIVGLASDPPTLVIVALSIFLGFFWVYQIIDAIRTAKAIQARQAVPDPFGLAQMFGTGEKFESAKVPIGAAVLIGLGVLFLLNTVFDFSLHRFWPLILIVLGVWLFAKHWGLLESHRPLCLCERCRTHKLMGPAILVTVGILCLLDSAGSVSFGRTWPALLLVIGVVKLLQSNASASGHMVFPITPAGPPTMPPPTMPPPPVPPQNPEQPPSSGEVNHV